ncbi:MAG: cytochrome P450 [Myxococcota bacterium]|jgi:cytochrome P450|nr:cytochrome P450 [Myxococcota bacterium]
MPSAQAKKHLAQIPGSDSFFELLALNRDPVRFFHERYDAHGQVFRTRFVYPVVFLIGAEANRSIMITNRSKFSFGRGYHQTSIRRVFDGSIMLQDGADHARTRGILQPAVDRLALKQSVTKIGELWQEMADILADGRWYDCYDAGQRTTYRVAGHALIGLETRAEAEALHADFATLMRGLMAPVPIAFPMSNLARALAARERLVRALEPRIEAARARAPDGMLDLLAHHGLDDGDALTVREVAEQVLLLFWAGYDTTASSVSWFFHVLARHPALQARIAAEMEAVVGEDIGEIMSAKLPVTDAFVREIERMYPSVLFFPRIAMEDIEFNGFTIPKGTPTFYSPYMSHHDPLSFERPDEFDPERWLHEDKAQRPKASLLVGFGTGPRTCLGKPFAVVQFRILLHQLLRRFVIEPDPDCQPTVMGLPIHHPVGSRVRFIPRR